MISAGIDVGAQTVKVVIVKDGRILAHSTVAAGWDPPMAAKQALDEAVKKAGISRSDIKKIVGTGIGRKELTFVNDSVSEVVCDAKGALFLLPSARTVIDIGADESRAMKCNAEGKVLDFAKNEKCAAGVGAFVEAMSRALEMSVDEMAKQSLLSDKDIPMNATCVIFAESEVVSLIHAKTPKPDIARAIHDAIASRTASMTRRLGVEEKVILIGGVAQNAGFVDCLKRRLGVDVVVPENPQIVGALGAALLATS
jgi:predicted CoA-substrate-specific enzyme activase